MTKLWLSARSIRRTRCKIIIKVTSNNQRLGSTSAGRPGDNDGGAYVSLDRWPKLRGVEGRNARDQFPFILKVLLLERICNDYF